MRTVPADEALAAIRDGSRVYVAAGCGVPTALVEAMAEGCDQWRRIEIVTGYLFEPLPLFAHAGRPFSFTSLHPTPALRGIAGDHLDVVPMRYGDHPAQLGDGGPRRPNVAIVQVAPPDGRGRYSLGVSVGSVIDAVRAADLVIAQVNEAMPYTFGDGELDGDNLDLLVEATTPLVESRSPPPSPLTTAIADHVAAEVPEGATLQIGVGRVPAAVLDALAGHRGLRLHSGMLTDGCRRLVDAGVLTGVCVTAEIVGGADLFAWAHRNRSIRMVGAATSHAPSVLLAQERFVAVNSALEVDLTGAANVEVTHGGEVVSGPGGLPDFAFAAFGSSTGRSIIALPSETSDGRSRIVTTLSGPAALPSYLADRVVTERGVAHLRGRTAAERRAALCQLAVDVPRTLEEKTKPS